MTWVAWRQQRPSTVAAVAVLAVAGSVLLVTGWQMTSFAHDSGLAACVASGGDCRLLAEAFANRYRSLLEPVSLLGSLLPVVLGLLFGGPLLAREFEQGTHRLAWTQSVTRSRWLGVRLAVAAGVLAVVAALAALLLTWWWGRLTSCTSAAGRRWSAAAWSRSPPPCWHLPSPAPPAPSPVGWCLRWPPAWSRSWS
jgi:hypothetical protein